MKRPSQALVTYSSSESDQEEPPKKRKLPSLPSSLSIPPPLDRPELHQGRIRTTPHKEGQWAAHVYVSLHIERHSYLYKLLDDALSEATSISPTLHSLWPAGEQRNQRTLHISLSRPTYLYSHQREELRRAIRGLSKNFSPFTASFSTFSELVNEERTRTFLAIDVGAGHHELRALSDALTPSLHVIRQKEFYPDPCFHASIAWALLDRPFSSDTTITAGTNPPLAEGTSGPPGAGSQPIPETSFPTIPYLPKNLIPLLNERFGTMLSSTRTGAFDVEEITIKIGKESHSWRLSRE